MSENKQNLNDLKTLETKHTNTTLRTLLRRFKPMLLGYKFRFLIAVFGMLLAAAAQAESAHIIEPILNKIFAEKQTDLLYILPFGVFALYLAKNTGLYLQITAMGFVGLDIANRLRKDILSKIIYCDLEFFKRHSSGELISRSLNDLNSLRVILAQYLPDLVREAFTAVGLLIVVVYQSPTLAFFAFIILPCALLPIRAFARRMRKIGVASQQNSAHLTSALSEIFANIELIKASGAERHERARFGRFSDEVSALAYRGIKLDALSSPTMETFGSLGVAIVLIIGGHEVIAGKMQVGNFFSFLTALFLLYQPIRRISSIYANLQLNLAACARTLAMLDLQAQIKSGARACARVEALDVVDFCLNYGEKRALKGVNMRFERGKIYALIGRSGSGKSSLINALMRFYEPSSGGILATVRGGATEEGGASGAGDSAGDSAANCDSGAGALTTPDASDFGGRPEDLAAGAEARAALHPATVSAGRAPASVAPASAANPDIAATTTADLAEFSLSSLRAQIALVSQNIYLFAGSVAHNVAYAQGLDEARVAQALELAGASEFVAELGGIHAELGEGGGSLSGGQRQRLALARAFYKNASVLIFDEATSALDNATQSIVAQAIERGKAGRIAIIIAHRLESIANADVAYVLDAGELVEAGPLEKVRQSEHFKLLKGEQNA